MTNESTQELLLLVGRIDAKVDELLDKSHDHNRRLRALEGWRWKLAGTVAGLAGYVSREHLHTLIAYLVT